MPYQTNIETFSNHIRAEVSGNRAPDEVVANADHLGQELVRTSRETGVDRILMILHLDGRLSATDAYDMMSNSEQYGWSRELKMAVVDLNEESLQDSQFVETVAVNRAFPISVFDNEEEAKDWLLS